MISNIVRYMPKVSSYTDYLYAYVTNNVEIILRIHNGKDSVLDENLNECGKELW